MPTPVVIPTTETSRAGTTIPSPVTGDVTNGHYFTNDGHVLLTVSNSAGASGTVTVAFGSPVDGNTTSPKVATIPASTNDVPVGPFPPSIYGSRVSLTVSAATLTLRAYHITPNG